MEKCIFCNLDLLRLNFTTPNIILKFILSAEILQTYVVQKNHI